MPKVSIGLPCYNEAPFIEETVRSVLAQTEEDFEFVICDNASTDGTLQIIERVCAGDPRVKIHPSVANIGGSANFLRAFTLTSAPYFMWMGAHDVLEKHYVKKLRLVLDADADCSLAYANSIFIAKDGSRPPGEQVEVGVDASDDLAVERFKKVLWQLIRCDMFHGLMRRQWIDTKLLTSCRNADTVLLASLALHGKFRRVPELLFLRRLNRDVEDEEAIQKRLVQQGCADASHTVADSMRGNRQAHLDLIAGFPLSPRQRNEMRLAVCQSFLERYCVEWDASETEATALERLRMRFASATTRDCIRQRIRQRVAMETRIDNALTRARMERELVALMKENHRLRKELAKVKR